VTDIDPVILGDLIDPTTFGNAVIDEINHRGVVDYGESTAVQTSIGGTDVDLTNLTVTFTATSTRIYRASLLLPHCGHSANATSYIKITSGANGLYNEATHYQPMNQGFPIFLQAILVGISGTQTVKARAACSSGILQLNHSSTARGILLVEDVGPA
jgi:hypothetical protein